MKKPLLYLLFAIITFCIITLLRCWVRPEFESDKTYFFFALLLSAPAVFPMFLVLSIVIMFAVGGFLEKLRISESFLFSILWGVMAALGVLIGSGVVSLTIIGAIAGVLMGGVHSKLLGK